MFHRFLFVIKFGFRLQTKTVIMFGNDVGKSGPYQLIFLYETLGVLKTTNHYSQAIWSIIIAKYS